MHLLLPRLQSGGLSNKVNRRACWQEADDESTLAMGALLQELWRIVVA